MLVVGEGGRGRDEDVGKAGETLGDRDGDLGVGAELDRGEGGRAGGDEGSVVRAGVTRLEGEGDVGAVTGAGRLGGDGNGGCTMKRQSGTVEKA